MNPADAAPRPLEPIQFAASPGFCSWMAGIQLSLALTTYQANRLIVIGWDGQQPTMTQREFDRPMGLAVRGPEIALATQFSVILLRDDPSLAGGYRMDSPGHHDALFLPRFVYLTGAIQAHDLAFGVEGLWVVNTQFSCLATLSPEYSFVPRWQPRFVSALAPGDRCHLNGLASIDGTPRYVTALGQSDEPGGWRARRVDGGLLIDVQTRETVIGGLSMPHSPRWHDGRLWALNSGAGELLAIDPTRGRGDVVCVLPGFLRGMSLHGPFAIIGMSSLRVRHLFSGLPVQERFGRLLCGVSVVDLRSGSVIGQLEFTSGCEELYEVATLPGLDRPMLLNLGSGMARHAFATPQGSCWSERGEPATSLPIPLS